jgi:hypothetical protein
VSYLFNYARLIIGVVRSGAVTFFLLFFEAEACAISKVG